jgi:tRNA(fMet)-specific endonuclease VapC
VSIATDIKFVLDTNACIAIMNRRPAIVFERLIGHPITATAISIVSRFELQYGVLRSARVEQNQHTLDAFLAYLQVLPFGDAQADEAAMIRIELERQGMPIGPFDTLIAAHARSIDAVLVTHNTREFARVAGLMVTDWEEDDV